MFSHLGLTASEADELAEAYFVLDRDSRSIARHFDLDVSLVTNLLLHPLTRAAIRRKVREMAGVLYSREEHIRMLKKIRDAALGDDNFKVALAGEIAVGKAAGLYENLRGDEDPNQLEGPPPESMTTDQLKQHIQKLLPPPGGGDTPLMDPEVRQRALDRLDDDDVAF